MKFVAVTSCPTGIAHTYMAAEALEQAAEDAGHEMQVETQGSAGSDPLSADIIAAADARHLRRGPRGQGQGAVRRQAVRRVGVKTGHRRRRRRCSARPRRRRPSGPAGRGVPRRPRPRAGGGGRPRRSTSAAARHPGPPVADDRRVVHDPVRRRRRHPDRAGLPVRRRRGRYKVNGGTDEVVTYTCGSSPSTSRRQLHFAQSCSPGCCSSSAAIAFVLPGADPVRIHRLRASPTGPAWCPASSAAARRARHGRRLPRWPGLRLCSPVSSPAGSASSRCRRACAASCRWWSFRWCRRSSSAS